MPIDFAFTAAIVVSTAGFIWLLYKIRSRADAIRNARRAETEAWSKACAQARAETLVCAYGLAKPKPGLHPVHPSHPAPAYVIPPASDRPRMPEISTDDAPDQPDTVAIHTMTIPIGAGEQSGSEIEAHGAGDQWHRFRCITGAGD